MHHVVLRERKRPTHQASQPLAQDIVEALNVAGLPLALTRRLVLLLGQYLGISCPKVCGSGLQLVADLLTNCLISPAPALSRDQKSSIHGRCSN